MKDRPAKYMITLSKGTPFRCSRVSPFEHKVYKETSKIPKGRVHSYKYIACRIGKPEAYRAVANALKKNPFIGKVPCHRVIKSDGTIGGFSRGIAMKKKLLKDEGLTIRSDTVIIKKR